MTFSFAAWLVAVLACSSPMAFAVRFSAATTSPKVADSNSSSVPLLRNTNSNSSASNSSSNSSSSMNTSTNSSSIGKLLLKLSATSNTTSTSNTSSNSSRAEAPRTPSVKAAGSNSSSNETITCYYSLAPEPGQPPRVAPVAFSRKDYPHCGRYQVQCSPGNDHCAAEEQQAKIWKWTYTPLSRHSCVNTQYMDKRLASSGFLKNSMSGTASFPVFRRMYCCKTDSCNAPDPKIDPQTKVVGRPPTMPDVVEASINCMSNVNNTRFKVRPKKFSKAAGFTRCVRYQHKCRPGGSPACSAAEIKAGTMLWRYTAISSDGCNDLKANATRLGYQHLMCCTTDTCNEPDPKLDPKTLVITWSGLATFGDNG